MDHGCPVLQCRDTGQLQQLAACDIVKRGVLHVKHQHTFLPPPFTIQAWKKRYVVLRDTWSSSPCVTSSLDIYDSERPAGMETSVVGAGGGVQLPLVAAGRHDPYSIDLRQLTAVGFYLESRRFQYAFYIERHDDRPLLFAAESDLEMRCWVAALRTLAEKARLGASTRNIRRSSTAALPGTAADSTDAGRFWTRSGVNGSVAAAANRRRLNLSDSQLHGVSCRLHGCIQPLYPRTGSTLTGSDTGGMNVHTPTPVSSSMEGETHSPGVASAATAGTHHPLRRMFSASMLGSLLRGDIGASRLRAFSKDRRKDSGFSDSFDEGQCDTIGDASTRVHVQDSASPAVGGSGSPPPTPPPRPPPRRKTVDDELLPVLRHPPPPLPSITLAHDELSRHRSEQCPPTPPPRPAHTLEPVAR